jgi:hypothetical protein
MNPIQYADWLQKKIQKHYNDGTIDELADFLGPEQLSSMKRRHTHYGEFGSNKKISELIK